MRPNPLFQLSGIGLDPTENGRVVNLHPAIEQHQFEIAVADWEHQAPPDRPQNHLIGKLPSPQLLAPPPCPPPPACVGQTLPVPHRARNPATEPLQPAPNCGGSDPPCQK